MADHFRILAQVNTDQLQNLGDSIGNAEGPVLAKHKWNSSDRPYCVANEIICNELGRFIGLPIPPFAVTYPDPIQLRNTTIKFFFSSIKVDFGGRDQRPMMGESCVKHLPELSAGIMMFDVFIANADRHDENLVVDDLNEPKHISVIDHDSALFGARLPGVKCGVERFASMKNRLGCTGGTKTAGNRHELIDHFTSTKYFARWCDRIYNIPREFITRVCDSARNHGLKKDQAVAARKFLLDRKDRLKGIVAKHKTAFKGIKKWSSL